MERQVFQLGNFQLEYGLLDAGTVPVLCFHGFGRPLEDMYLFSQILQEGEYIVSAHLFHHGKSQWLKSTESIEGLSVVTFAKFIDAFLLHLNAKKFNLIGYSLGGRICMNLFLERAQQVDKMLLLAPDGLYKNPFYVWSIRSGLGRKVFSSLINNPLPLLNTVDFLRSIKLFPNKLHRFIHVHMGKDKNFEERNRILSSWTTFLQFFPNLKDLVQALETYQVSFSLILGEYDTVIKKKHAKHLLENGLEPTLIHYLESGHLLLNQKSIEYIQSEQLWN